jgi:hypothetical protein
MALSRVESASFIVSSQSSSDSIFSKLSCKSCQHQLFKLGVEAADMAKFNLPWTIAVDAGRRRQSGPGLESWKLFTNGRQRNESLVRRWSWISGIRSLYKPHEPSRQSRLVQGFYIACTLSFGDTLSANVFGKMNPNFLFSMPRFNANIDGW